MPTQALPIEDQYSRANELRQARQKGLASKAADMAIKKVLPEVAIAEKFGKLFGFDVMKWIKRSVIIGVTINFVYIVSSFLLIFLIVAFVTGSIGAIFADPISALKSLWYILNPGTVENSGPVFDIGGA